MVTLSPALRQHIPAGPETQLASWLIESYVRLSSGMLPGYVAGYYTYEECHVDLAKLTSFARARLIIATATGIDTQACSPQCSRL